MDSLTSRSKISKQLAVKIELYEDPTRKHVRKGKVYYCEGQGFVEHKCYRNLELNHVLIPKGIYQKLSTIEREYFDHVINCALNCSSFHTRHGHSFEYRRWHFERVCRRYTRIAVVEWALAAPLKLAPSSMEATELRMIGVDIDGE